MKVLTRYIFKELVGPTVLGFIFYTAIILMKSLFDLAQMIIRRSLPGSVVGKLLLLSLPHIIVLTVPMSLLFGILIAIGRLSADSEIIAMRALGISTRTIYRPVFIFSFLVFALNLWLMNVVMPKGNRQLTALTAELLTSSAEKEIKPRVFYDEYENMLLYVDDVDPRTSQWKGVFVADARSDETEAPAPSPAQIIAGAKRKPNATAAISQQPGGQRIIVADSGNLSIIKQTRQVWLNLRNAQTHVWDQRKPDRYDLNRNATQRILLQDKKSTDVYVRSMREMTLPELLEQARLTKKWDPETHRIALIEIHKKFAIPFACLVFGVVGLPLGITNRRGGRSSGFSLSIAIITFYYILINNGEHLAASGKVSHAVGMWAANVILLVLGIYLAIRANRERGQRSDGGIFGKIVTFFRARRPARAGELATTDEDEPSILRSLDITFPNTIDRYILREFLKVLLLVALSTVVMITIVDYTEISGDIRANNVPFHVVFAYYRFMIFQILNWTLPISVLVSTLVTFSMLAKNNEVTAIKSSGVSLYRVALPIVAVAAIISILAYLMLDFVLPYSNQRVEQLKRRIKGQKTVAASAQQKQWFLGKGRYVINFLSYDRNAKELTQVQVFEMHPTEFRLTRRVFAQRATWDGIGWVFSDGWMRSFDDAGASTYTPITHPLRFHYTEQPDDFATEAKAPETMSFAQLRRYINTVRNSGYAAEELTVKLYGKTSWPAISLIMALIALPFAFRMGKRGTLYGVGIALVVGILYWMIYAIFTKFGEVGNLPPILSAWSANILFGIAAIYMFLHVET